MKIVLLVVRLKGPLVLVVLIEEEVAPTKVYVAAVIYLKSEASLPRKCISTFQR